MRVIKALKCPGTDGHPGQDMKLLQVFNGSKAWPNPKNGRDQLNCANFRPVCLLKQDYNILTSILARKLQVILPDILNLDQTGFIDTGCNTGTRCTEGL